MGPRHLYFLKAVQGFKQDIRVESHWVRWSLKTLSVQMGAYKLKAFNVLVKSHFLLLVLVRLLSLNYNMRRQNAISI